MTPEQFAAARKATGLGVVEFGRALGYQGNDNSVSVHVRRMESGGRPILPPVARLAAMFALHGVPDLWVNGPPPADADRLDRPEAWAIVESVGSA